MMVPIRGGDDRNGMGSVLSGLMVCMKILSPNAPCWRPALVVAKAE
jgi:hypothetical protein